MTSLSFTGLAGDESAVVTGEKHHEFMEQPNLVAALVDGRHTMRYDVSWLYSVKPDMMKLLLKYGHQRCVQPRIARLLGISEAAVSKDVRKAFYESEVAPMRILQATPIRVHTG